MKIVAVLGGNEERSRKRLIGALSLYLRENLDALYLLGGVFTSPSFQELVKKVKEKYMIYVKSLPFSLDTYQDLLNLKNSIQINDEVYLVSDVLHLPRIKILKLKIFGAREKPYFKYYGIESANFHKELIYEVVSLFLNILPQPTKHSIKRWLKKLNLTF